MCTADHNSKPLATSASHTDPSPHVRGDAELSAVFILLVTYSFITIQVSVTAKCLLCIHGEAPATVQTP